MRFELHIDYPTERFEVNRRRMEARAGFQYHDRVPVAYCVVPRYFAPILGIPYRDLFKDAETQYHCLLQFAKYRMEHIDEDIWGAPVVTVAPYFDNVVNPSAFGATIGWGDSETPRAIPILETPEQAANHPMPEPDAGLWGQALRWREEMIGFAAETRVTIGGVEGHVNVAPPCIGGEGPHMVAVDLAGENLYWWVLEYPQACHKLMDTITRGMIRAEEHFRRVDPTPRGGFGLAEDSAQIMSAKLFRQFVVPYDNILYDRFGAGLADGRGMHMCGDSAHLLDSLRDDARISSFNVFGYRVAPELVAEKLGGHAYLWGNIDPMLMRDGSPAEVKAAAHRCLAAMGPCGGLMLGDGANVCPGTPLENLAAVTQAAEEYGRPEVRRG